MKLVLLGAGASRAALGLNAPVSCEFGQVLSSRVPDWRARFPFLASAVRYLSGQDRSVTEEAWALDRVWNGIDENFKLKAFIANSSFHWPGHVPPARIYTRYAGRTWSNFWVLAGCEIKRAVNQVYGLLLDNSIADYAVGPGGALTALLHQLAPGDVVASTNYDLLAERIIRANWPSANNCRDAEDARARTGESGPMLLKLHGSLDWDFVSPPKGDDSVERSEGPMPDDSIDDDDQGREHRPLLIAPVRFKDDVLVPATQPSALVQTLAFQWTQLVDAVFRADELVVLGYSFPADDAYGNRMFQEGVRRRPDNGAIQTHIYVKDDCIEVRSRLRQLLPPSSVAECLGPLKS
jgi:hypothetical protein